MPRETQELAERLRRSIKDSSTDLAHELMSVLFAPLARGLGRLGIQPNMVTVAGCLVVMGAGALIATGHWYAALGVALFGGLLDGVDGLLARESQQTTPFGAFLDSVLDRWSDSALFIGLLIWYSGTGGRLESILSIWALASSLLVSYTRARAEGIGAECRRGLFTRLERVGLILAGLAFNQMTIVLWIVAVLSTFTALQRIYFTWKSVQALQGE